VARQSALKARTQAANEMHALVVTAPDTMRAQLRKLKLPQLVSSAAAFRPSAKLTTPTAATKLALKSIATRYRHLTAEIDALDSHLDQLVVAAAPELVAIKGVGTDIASTLLTIAGDNPERLASEGGFAHMVGVAPIEASSGKITRYRLNRDGDRQGNRALYLLAGCADEPFTVQMASTTDTPPAVKHDDRRQKRGGVEQEVGAGTDPRHDEPTRRGSNRSRQVEASRLDRHRGWHSRPAHDIGDHRCQARALKGTADAQRKRERQQQPRVHPT
jgi:hypothetical protein